MMVGVQIPNYCSKTALRHPLICFKREPAAEPVRPLWICSSSTSKGESQYDVKNAFVHADINEKLYVILPISYYTEDKYKNKVYRLRKALYGLKQALRL